MGLMEGKKGIIFGIANDRSYATYITKSLLEHGATCAFTHLPGDKMERRCRKAVEELGVTDPWLVPCDASSDADLDAVFDKLAADFGTIDFLVHSIAFADRQFLQVGNFHTTTREAFTQALDISAYTLVAMAQRAAKIMPNGGSIISMTYYGGEKVVPGYNVMGIAKAALEHSTRYLATELGRSHKIRVNAISGGPLRTLAASAVGKINEMFEHQEAKSALGRNIEGEEVGNTGVYLLSDLSSGVTGETIHVDAGYSIVGW
ncbi:MAG: SDR family oxidoreductase [Phycisphaera sp.]|nr:SDR family oxidoreductase [Phycisphaera sp.]